MIKNKIIAVPKNIRESNFDFKNYSETFRAANSTIMKILPKFKPAEMGGLIKYTNNAISSVLIDEEAKEIIENVPIIMNSILYKADKISIDNPGQMHFKVFELPFLKILGLKTYLAADEVGKKILMIAGNEKHKKIFSSLDFTVAILTSESGHNVFSYGGIGKYITDISMVLSEYFNVRVLGWDPENKLNGEEKKLSETLSIKGFPWLKPKGYQIVVETNKLSRTMVDYLSDKSVEGVFFNSWYNAGALPFFSEKFPNSAVFSIFHSVQPQKPFKAADLGGQIGFIESCEMEANYVSDKVDGVICISDGNIKDIQNSYPGVNTRDGKFKKIFHGIHLNNMSKVSKSEFMKYMRDYIKKYPKFDQSFSIEENEDLNKKILSDLGNKKIILFIGRLSGQKGLDLLVDAIDKMDDSAVALVVATSPDNPKMKELAEKILPKHKKIFWINEHIKTKNVIEAIWTNADIFVCPSTNEPFGYVLLEANLASLPVVAFHGSGGPDEIIQENKNGKLVPMLNTAELAKTLDYLVKNENELNRLKKSSLENVQNRFDLRKNTSIETYQFWYDKILLKQKRNFEHAGFNSKKDFTIKEIYSNEFKDKFGSILQADLLSNI